jgi:ketosteroid isomerase-like protein
MLRTVLALILFGLAIGCGETQTEAPVVGSVEQWKAELMEADRTFSRTVGEEGLSAWGSFFAADGAVVQEGVGEIRGVEAVQASMDASADAISEFSWAPDRAEVSESGDLGYTVGRSHMVISGPDGSVMETTGMYVSIWRRQPDESWKVEMDLGNVITPPTPLSSGNSTGSKP